MSSIRLVIFEILRLTFQIERVYVTSYLPWVHGRWWLLVRIWFLNKVEIVGCDSMNEATRRRNAMPVGTVPGLLIDKIGVQASFFRAIPVLLESGKTSTMEADQIDAFDTYLLDIQTKIKESTTPHDTFDWQSRVGEWDSITRNGGYFPNVSITAVAMMACGFTCAFACDASASILLGLLVHSSGERTNVPVRFRRGLRWMHTVLAEHCTTSGQLLTTPCRVASIVRMLFHSNAEREIDDTTPIESGVLTRSSVRGDGPVLISESSFSTVLDSTWCDGLASGGIRRVDVSNLADEDEKGDMDDIGDVVIDSRRLLADFTHLEQSLHQSAYNDVHPYLDASRHERMTVDNDVDLFATWIAWTSVLAVIVEQHSVCSMTFRNAVHLHRN